MSRFGFNKKVKNPSGTWNLEQLLGAKIHVKSTSVGNFMSCFNFDSSKLVTIKNIYFRVSMDGKAFTVVEVEEFPEKVFLWKDIEIVELTNKPRFDALCGAFDCGQSVAGYNVSSELSQDTNESNGGLSLVDDSGNVITNRYIRFLGADVENIKTDMDNITDISINIDGDILD